MRTSHIIRELSAKLTEGGHWNMPAEPPSVSLCETAPAAGASTGKEDVRATLGTVSCGELTAVYRKDSDTGIVELVSWIVDASSVL